MGSPAPESIDARRLAGLAIAAFLVLGCAPIRVPQARLSVKGKGFAAVLTRSLRFAAGCGFRAAP